MKKSELVKYRRLINEEIERRKGIESLSFDVKDLLRNNGIKLEDYQSDDIDGIVAKILSSFKVTETNGIYVCVLSYFEDWRVCYEETMISNVIVNISSPMSEYRLYRNIEDESQVMAYKGNSSEYPSFSDFESNNIILNPYNDSDENNGYDEVRPFFFKTCISNSQEKTKKLLLEKYPRL